MTVTVETITDQIKMGRVDEAREALKTVAETDENRAELLFLRGYLEEAGYEREAAVATYEKVLELDPEHKQAAFRAAFLYDLFGHDERAIELYEACTSGESASVNALLNLAVLCEEQGRLDDAERCLQSVLTKHPNHHRANYFLESVESSYTMAYDEKSQRERERCSAVLSTPVTDFELSVRSRNCLRQMNIRTLGDLLKTTEAELLSYKNFGETSLNEIKAMLRQKGLALGQGLQPTGGPVLPSAFAGEETDAGFEAMPEAGFGAMPEAGFGAMPDAGGGAMPVTGLDDAFGAFSSPRPSMEPIAADPEDNKDRPVSELELSVRSRQCLQSLGVKTLGELAGRSEAELMAVKNFGQTSMSEIKRQLARYGLSLEA